MAETGSHIIICTYVGKITKCGAIRYTYGICGGGRYDPVAGSV